MEPVELLPVDLVVVVEGIISLVMDFSGNKSTSSGVVKVLRMLRVLRPLRTAQRVPQMKIIIEAMAKSLFTIWNVLVVYATFLMVSSLIAITLWRKYFNSQCFDDADVPYLVFDQDYYTGKSLVLQKGMP